MIQSRIYVLEANAISWYIEWVVRFNLRNEEQTTNVEKDVKLLRNSGTIAVKFINKLTSKGRMDKIDFGLTRNGDNMLT